MNWEPLRAWLDNPIFVKHVRSRLRKQPLIAAGVVVMVLCMCIAWAGYQLDWFVSGRAFEWLVVLQGIILIVMGASQISAAVGVSRSSGVLDFHRVSPLTPTELTLGFFFGAPIREYILFACTLPFAALFLAFGVPSFHGFVEVMIFLVAVAWLFHGLALLNSLLRKGQRSARGAVGVVIFFVLIFFNALRMGRFIPSVALFDQDGRLTFFGYSLPWLAVVLFYVAAVLYFVFLAARRKMGSEPIHPLSKPQAITALASLSILFLGGIWALDNDLIPEMVLLYLLVITAVLLVLMVTPDRAEYFKGLWRAKKQGRTHLPWWDDLSLNRAFLVVACAIVFSTATIAWTATADSSAGPRFPGGLLAGNLPLAIAISVLVVAYFGLAHQYFLLNFGGRGKIYFSLFLFLVWLLPLVAGTILAMSSSSGDGGPASQLVFSLSPIPGIGMVAAPVQRTGLYAMAVQGPAITLPLLFLFVFNSLLVTARRKAFKAFVASTANMEMDDPTRPANHGDGARDVKGSLVEKYEASP